jgi:hypothetical protein
MRFEENIKPVLVLISPNAIPRFLDHRRPEGWDDEFARLPRIYARSHIDIKDRAALLES